MWLFNRKKKEDTVIWRDSNGKIACTGDKCVKECNEECPIWLNTVGLSLIKIGQFEKAITAFEDALRLAPDFYDAQNNMGSAYGHSGRHREAYESFKKALEMEKRATGMSGLIVSEIKLGMYDDALKHCDELEEMGRDASRFRADILSLMG